MHRLPLVLGLVTAVSASLHAQSSRWPLDASIANYLNFESEPADPLPAGWHGGPPETLFADEAVVHSGKRAGRIERGAGSQGAFSTMTATLPLDVKGEQLELHGFIRTENVSGYAGLWMREDGRDPNLAFDNMQRQQLKGTTDWHEYTITLPLKPEARTLTFGFLVGGTGKAWVDDLRLLVDGKPIWEAPKAVREVTVLDRDREFDSGSKIAMGELSPVQIQNLATLGRTWGFLKYHHPRVTGGELHWDYELFRIMPTVLAAADRAAANEALATWIEHLGAVTRGASHAVLPDAVLKPDNAWIDDRATLGDHLSTELRAVYAARPAGNAQFYLSLAPGVRNPIFDHELNYTQIKFPDPGFQLLALFRFWNIIRYWSPYRDLVQGNWDATLTEFIPRLARATTLAEYQRELIAVIARVQDTHANLWSGLRARPPAGAFRLPATFRFIEGRATVVRCPPSTDGSATAGGSTGLQRGDVVVSIDGTSVEELVAQWSPYYAASNEPTRLRDIAHTIGTGPSGLAHLRVQRGDATLAIDIPRVPITVETDPNANWHDLPGKTFRLLTPDVGYLKLSGVKLEECPRYVEQAGGTKGLIIDLRNYPAAFVVFALGNHFVSKPTQFVTFTTAQPDNPGSFAFGQTLSLKPELPTYKGKIVILVDEVTQSSAEYTTMAFRTAPGAVVIGSTTAGADGNISRIPLPGGQYSLISGIGVFYPDTRPTQGVGIVPDITVKPTLAGIRAGRDELLEAALRQILGPATPAADLEKLSHSALEPASPAVPNSEL